jgi:hypothetical protein
MTAAGLSKMLEPVNLNTRGHKLKKKRKKKEIALIAISMRI